MGRSISHIEGSVWGNDEELDKLISSVADMRARVGGEPWQPKPKESQTAETPPSPEQLATAAKDITAVVYNHIDEILGDAA